MSENFEKVQKGFRILHPKFGGYVVSELVAAYQDKWMDVARAVLSDQERDLPPAGATTKEFIDCLDIANLIRLFDRQWPEVFKKKLSVDYRTWAKELMGVRNRVAHQGHEDISDNDAWRALDTMARLCAALDAEATSQINDLVREVRYGSELGSMSVATNQAKQETQSISTSGLPSWRDIVEPHPDVAQGRYRNAEFAADLAQVARGEGAFEYRDPVEFFARTYVTSGMTSLLLQSIARVAGDSGEPVIQLKTAFGGGKTHSMLALYHMMRGFYDVQKVPNLKAILDKANIGKMPKVSVAVLVGTAMDPSKNRRPNNFPGITINTIWGEMTAQLAMAAGKPEVYELVKEADKKGVSPGSEVLKNIFDACSPCMVLMDELVAYAKKIYGHDDLPAGTFDNFVSFIQEVTEAARASQHALVVASIPESIIEIGGDAGQTVLDTIEHTFGRMEAIWKPVAADEGFEVVRRRLFLDCKSPELRAQICEKYSQYYKNNSDYFPQETKELEYRRRMEACYPIHPEIFDRLYEDWGTLERFQRTRGVLRLMAAVIHELWMQNDASPMIMVGSIPLEAANVRDELLRHLPQVWQSIVDREVDGKSSIPYQQDQRVATYGQRKASRRLARTVMLGSAPTSNNDQSVRGIEMTRIRLGTLMPEENIAIFNDALYALRGSESFLYSTISNERFWFDTQPTLRKTAADRAAQLPEDDVTIEIERRLLKVRSESPFSGVHCCPVSSADVPDEKSMRLVLLRLDCVHKATQQDSTAIKVAEDMLRNRGTSPRMYRNMLAFVAPDASNVGNLKASVRSYLAWKSIYEDRETLNLDVGRIKESEQNIARQNEVVETHLKETYVWLLVPSIDVSVDIQKVSWDCSRLAGGESIVSKSRSAMLQNGTLIAGSWSPLLLRTELDKYLWKERDHISATEIWDYLTRHLYLSRLANYGILEESIRKGVNNPCTFGLATEIDKDGKYVGLRFDEPVTFVNDTDLIVKKDIAVAQGRSVVDVGPVVTPPVNPNPPEPTDVPPNPASAKKTFTMSAPLDSVRVNKNVQKILEEIVQNLTDGEWELSLEATFKGKTAIDQKKIRIVTENCRTLKITEFEFGE